MVPNIAYCDVNDVSIVYKKKLPILWLYDYGNDREAGSHEKIPTYKLKINVYKLVRMFYNPSLF